MLKPVLDIAVPALVFLLMAVVGRGLTAADFRRVARHPRLVILATLDPFVRLPLIALLPVWSPGRKPSLQQGVLLVAACPTGSLANRFTYLARANVALSVSLTAVSCLTTAEEAIALIGAQDAKGLHEHQQEPHYGIGTSRRPRHESATPSHPAGQPAGVSRLCRSGL